MKFRDKELLDNLPHGAALYELDGAKIKAIHINQHYWKLVEREPVEYGDASVVESIFSDDRQSAIDEIQEAIRQGRNASVDIRIRCGEKGYKPFKVSAKIQEQDNGKYLLYVSYTPISVEAMSIQEKLPIILSTVMNTSEDISFIKDKDGRYVTCSKSAVYAFGLESEKDIIGKTNVDIFGISAVEQFVREDKEIIETGKSIVNRLAKLPVSSGDMGMFRTSKYPLLGGNNKVIGIYCICRDVTVEKATEFELNTLLRVVPSGIIKCSATEAGEFEYINRSFIDALGYTEEQFRTKFHNHFRDMVWAENDNADYLSLEANATAGQINRADIRIEAANGQLRWFHVEGVRIVDENNKAWYYVTLVDVTDRKNIEDNLRLVEEENHLAIEHSGNIITRFDVKSRTLTMPESLTPIFKIPKVLQNIPHEQIELGRISQETADDYTELFDSIISGEAAGSALFQQNSTKGWRWLKAQYTTVFDSNGNPASAVISFSDVTENLEKEVVYTKWQQSIEERPKDSYALFRCNLNRNASYDVWEGTLLSVELGDATHTFNENTAEFASQCVYEGDREKYLTFVNSDKMLAEYYRNHRSDSIQFRGILPDGTIRWLKLSVDLVESPQSKEIEAFMLYENIDEQKKTELESQHMAETDPLTGLLNRQAFSARVNELIRNSKPDAKHAFFMLDLDGFKLLNDTFGHAAGDDALVEIAQKLQKMLRKGDVLARLGGDEFVVFLSNISREEGIAKKAEQINKNMLKAYSAEVQISTSIGIALYPRDGLNSHDLYEKADTALYAAKEAGRNTFLLYSHSLPDKGIGADSHEMRADGVKSTEAPAKLRRMLIVDDSQIEIMLLKNIFEKDFIVDIALDGASALSRMRHYGSALSVVLLDLNMEGLSGFDVLEKAQNSPEMHGVPIIVVSGEDDRDTCMQAIRSGAADYLIKPVDPEVIRLRVSAAISRAENERLRAQNSYLQLRENETSRYQVALNGMGMFVVELDWIKGTFIYDPTISQYLKGTYDDRTLWRILLTDMVASAADVRALQDFIHKLANDHDRISDSIEIPLATPSKEKHRFKLTAKKILSDRDITQKLVIAFKDQEPKANSTLGEHR